MSPDATEPDRHTPSYRRDGKLPLSLIGGFTLVAVAVIAGFGGAQWSSMITAIIGGLLLMLWPRRIFRAGITRTGPEELVVRSAPWYEGFVYGSILISPVLGAVMLVQVFGSTASSSGKRFVFAVFLLMSSIFIPWGCIKLRRRCFLRITPATLRSGILTPRSFRATPDPKAIKPVLELTRDEVQGITVWNIPLSPVDRRWLGIFYRLTPDGAPALRFVGGSQLTVQPDNLLHALQAWHSADPGEPAKDLMDRIQTILQDRPETGPDHRHWGGGPGSGGKGPIGAMMFLADTSSGIYFDVKLKPKIVTPSGGSF